jgi:hypothetical protein
MAQLVRKHEWMEAYIKARSEVLDTQHIDSSWRGAGLFSYNLKRALRTIEKETTPEAKTTIQPTPYDAFDRVFVNSSPPDAQSLQKANEPLLSTIERRTILSTPVRKYIRKLALGTEQLRAKSIVYQHDANNLRSIVKKRTTRTKGKRVILKGHFYISTQELHKGVVEAELDTKTRAKKKMKTKGRAVSYEAESEEDIEEEARDELESEIEDCVIVDVK